MALFIRSGVNRANIENFCTMGVGEALIGKGEAAESDQENSNQDCGFHIVSFLN